MGGVSLTQWGPTNLLGSKFLKYIVRPTGKLTRLLTGEISFIKYRHETDYFSPIPSCSAKFNSSAGSQAALKDILGLPWWVHWLRIGLPMQGTWVRSLGWADPTYCKAAKSERHSY